MAAFQLSIRTFGEEYFRRNVAIGTFLYVWKCFHRRIPRSSSFFFQSFQSKIDSKLKINKSLNVANTLFLLFYYSILLFPYNGPWTFHCSRIILLLQIARWLIR